MNDSTRGLGNSAIIIYLLQSFEYLLHSVIIFYLFKKDRVYYFFLPKIAKMVSTHPLIKLRPPMGVIGPSQIGPPSAKQ